jgi:hypothetical protein
MASMLRVWQDALQGRHIAGEFVRDHHAWLVIAASQNLAQKAFGNCLVPPLLHQDVEHDALLVDRSPEPVPLAPNLQQYLIQVPLVPDVCLSASQSRRVARTELGAPLADGLVADDDAALSKQVLNVSEAEVERKYSQTAWAITSGGKRRPR